MKMNKTASYVLALTLISGSFALSGIATADKHMSDDMREMMMQRDRDRDDCMMR